MKVLVDSVAVNRAGGAFDLANLSTDDIDRIEVVRGPGGVLYGSDAVTGVIAIFAGCEGRGPVGASLSSEAGDSAPPGRSGGLAGRAGRRIFHEHLAAQRSNGIYRFNSGYGSHHAEQPRTLAARRPRRCGSHGALQQRDPVVSTDFTGAPNRS